MTFRSHDNLRLFVTAARHLSFTGASKELNLSKGAVSYQVARLEESLGFLLFQRGRRGITLTERGKRLLDVAEPAFSTIESEIGLLRDRQTGRITIGLSTYFASRWLSERLMRFLASHPRIGLRLQPLVDLIDLRAHDIDLAIRWGNGQWRDLTIEPLLACPAFPTAGSAVAEQVRKCGLKETLRHVPLLHDHDGSRAWHDWLLQAGLPNRPQQHDLIIPDPNVRVQAVIDNQGIALNDDLIAQELAQGRLHKVSEIQLEDYGYFLAFSDTALNDPNLKDFRDWIHAEANAAA